MNEVDEKLSSFFDVAPIEQVATAEQQQTSLVVVAEEVDEKNADLQHVRKNLYTLIDQGSDAVKKALVVATESQHPRAFEVAGNLIKNVADLTDKLVALQKAKQDLEVEPESSSPKNVNIDKAVFVGSTAELLKMIKNESNTE